MPLNVKSMVGSRWILLDCRIFRSWRIWPLPKKEENKFKIQPRETQRSVENVFMLMPSSPFRRNTIEAILRQSVENPLLANILPDSEVSVFLPKCHTQEALEVVAAAEKSLSPIRWKAIFRLVSEKIGINSFALPVLMFRISLTSYSHSLIRKSGRTTVWEPLESRIIIGLIIGWNLTSFSSDWSLIQLSPFPRMEALNRLAVE